MCRETSRRRVIAWALALLAGVLILVFNWRYVKNFIGGPYRLEAEDLAQITNPGTAPHYFVSVLGEKVVDTGIQEITTTTRNGVKEGSYVSAGYYALLVSDHLLIVKSKVQPPSKVEGELSSFPPDLSGQLFSGAHGREIQTRCYPFYLESDGFRYAGYWGIGIGLIFFALFFKYGRPSWVYVQDVNKHPVIRRIQQWSDPVGVSVDAERELGSKIRYKSQGVFITDKYVILKRLFAFDLLRFEDLLWAYKRVTKRSVNFIPTGKDYDAVLIFYGGSQTFRARQNLVDEVLVFASTRAPWAVLGYSKELDALFRKQTIAFCQAVEARRQGIL